MLVYQTLGGFIRQMRRCVLCLPPPSPSISPRVGWTQDVTHESLECYSLIRGNRKASLRGRADRGWEFIILSGIYPPPKPGHWILDQGFAHYLGDAMEYAETLLEASHFPKSDGVH